MGWTLPYLIAMMIILAIEPFLVKKEDSTLGILFSRHSRSVRHDLLFFFLAAFQFHRWFAFIFSFGIGGYIYYFINSTLGWPGLMHFESLLLKSFCYLLIMDFTAYWYHRSMHAIPCLWAVHRLHHSAHQLSPLTTHRNHPIGLAYKSLFFAFPVAIVGPYVEAYSLSLFIQMVSGFFLHSRYQCSFGFWGTYIFNSSYMHTNHHNLTKDDQCSNYGFFFIFWDWIFGTARIPERSHHYNHGVEGLNGSLPLMTLFKICTVDFFKGLKPTRPEPVREREPCSPIPLEHPRHATLTHNGPDSSPAFYQWKTGSYDSTPEKR